VPVASAAAAEAARAGAVRAGLGLVDLEGPTFEVFAVQGGDGLESLFLFKRPKFAI